MYFQIHNIQTGSHYFLRRFFSKTDDSLQHIVFFRCFLNIRQFQRLRKFIDRQVPDFPLL